jgi:CelD/BcsL family acetyltransferase involved in cellulose biosynthesis
MHHRWLEWSELTEAQLRAWAALEGRSRSGNAFASPFWVAPSVQFGAPPPRVLWIGSDARPNAILPVQALGPTVRVPMPHWRAFWTAHSYQSGVLCDDAVTLPAIASALRHSGRDAVEFVAQPEDAESEALDIAFADQGATWIGRKRWERAALELGSVPAHTLSKNQRKKLRRARRRLEEHGPLHWRTVQASPDIPDAADAFIGLEHMGWKGLEGTSIRASQHRETWFSEVVRGFASEGRAVFTQLYAGETLVASSANWRSGDIAFGFKIGWNTAFADASPGMVHEDAFVTHAADAFAGASLIDAVADEGSFVERLWPHRRWMRTGAYAFSAGGVVALMASRELGRRA